MYIEVWLLLRFHWVVVVEDDITGSLMSQLQLSFLATPSEEQEGFVRLFEEGVVVFDEGRSGINCIKLFNLSFHVFVEHDIADILHIGKALVLKVVDDVSDVLLLYPDEDHAIFHH